MHIIINSLPLNPSQVPRFSPCFGYSCIPKPDVSPLSSNCPWWHSKFCMPCFSAQNYTDTAEIELTLLVPTSATRTMRRGWKIPVRSSHTWLSAASWLCSPPRRCRTGWRWHRCQECHCSGSSRAHRRPSDIPRCQRWQSRRWTPSAPPSGRAAEGQQQNQLYFQVLACTRKC